MSKVQFEVQADREYRPVDGDFILRLALRLGVSDRAEAMPLNLCVLIDKSASMAGEKIEKAADSARQLINALRDGDTFSLLSFGSSVTTHVRRTVLNDETRREAQAAVDGITPGGVTRMGPALEAAYAILSEGGSGYMNLLLFLSDGAPTDEEGYLLEDEAQIQLTQTIASSFRQHHITTSAVGLGDAAECLAPFLERCGEDGGGIFYHAEDSNDLSARFLEELDRVKATAISDVSFYIRALHGQIRKACSIYPDIRELAPPAPQDGFECLEGGALRQGEEHVFLVEVVTPAGREGERIPLCDLEAVYQMDGREQRLSASGPIIEYSCDDSLLEKPPHGEVEKYKGMYNAFMQSQRAADNFREGGDPKKTKVLLASAARTTKRLGLGKQTKLLQEMVQKIDTGADFDENDITAVAVASRKTKVLGR